MLGKNITSEKIRMYLDQNHDVNVQDDYGRTLLMISSWRGLIEIVSELLEKGAHIDSLDSNNNTALIYASINDEVDVVKFLISEGASMENKNDNGLTFAEYFRNKKDIEEMMVCLSGINIKGSE